MVLGVADEGHPLEQRNHGESRTGVQAVLIGNDYPRSTSYPLTPPDRPAPMEGQRATSDPNGIYQTKNDPQAPISPHNPRATPIVTFQTPVTSTAATATATATPATPSQSHPQSPPLDLPPLLQAEVLEGGGEGTASPPPMPAPTVTVREHSHASSTGSRTSHGSGADSETASTRGHTSSARSVTSVNSAERRNVVRDEMRPLGTPTLFLSASYRRPFVRSWDRPH